MNIEDAVACQRAVNEPERVATPNGGPRSAVRGCRDAASRVRAWTAQERGLCPQSGRVAVLGDEGARCKRWRHPAFLSHPFRAGEKNTSIPPPSAPCTLRLRSSLPLQAQALPVACALHGLFRHGDDLL